MAVTTAVLVTAAATGCDDDTCEWDGETYQQGDVFPAGDGCNSCMCGDDGQVSCSQVACVDTCEWDGETYQQGDVFPAGDGCNSCMCGDDGQVSCSQVACADAGP